jgi:hypothetical protein
MADKEKHGHDKHSRRSIRLKDYDYSQQGAYFVTICAKSRRCLFGEIIDGEIRLNEIGVIIRDQWVRSAEVRKEIHIDEFVIMPNHLHGIIVIEDNPVGATGGRPFALDRPRVWLEYRAGWPGLEPLELFRVFGVIRPAGGMIQNLFTDCV